MHQFNLACVLLANHKQTDKFMDSNDIEFVEEQPLPEMKTLVACINKWAERGFTDTFTVSEKGLNSKNKDKFYLPEEVAILDFYRFEGQSDPSDSSIMYVVETNDHAKGVIIDAFGAYADAELTHFMSQVVTMDKKNANKVVE